MLSKGFPLKPYRSNLKFNFWDSICQFTCFRLRFDHIYLSCPDTQRSMDTRVGIGYPKFGYPRVIPGPEPNFGYGLGWVCVWIPWVFSGWVPIKFKILGFFGYYPWVPMRIGYPKFGHPRVIPKINYGKKCSFSQKYKYH